MILDRNLCYAAANPAYEAATGRSFSELAGRDVFEVFPNAGEAGRRLRASLNRVFDAGAPDTIPFIEYEIPVPDAEPGTMERRYWTAIHTPLFDAEGEVVFVLQNTVDITKLERLRAAASEPSDRPSSAPGTVQLVQRAREAEETLRHAQDSPALFRRLFDEAPGMVGLLHGPDHVMAFANQALRKFLGSRPLIGVPVRVGLPEMSRQGFADLLDHVFATGEPMMGFGSRILVEAFPGARPVESFLDFSYTALRDRDDRITGILVQGYDRTDAVRAQQRQRLLIDELNHRVKNTLSAVQSLARRSFSATDDPEQARRVFEARILALSNVHNLLSERSWESADLETILRLELDAFDAGRYETTGGHVPLNPKATIALAMVFHELASNAVKYGAFAGEGGRLAVNWQHGEGELSLTWREIGAPAPAAISPGFGVRMLERIVTGELVGQLSVDFAGSDLIWHVTLPRSEIEDLAHALHS